MKLSFKPLLSLHRRYFSTGSMSTGRSYRDAIDSLNSLQSNAATLEAVRASGGRLSQFAIPEMIEYLERIGYSTDQLNSLRVIHITGTKGKGSTSAFTDSILRQSRPNWNIGLYTSPHLVAVRERIRVNGRPISEESFARYFFEVWDRLEANDVRLHSSTPSKPMYFRFVTLLAFHVFLTLKVDATILEVGVGGAYDSTNIVPKPLVTGVTALGIDHTAVLGNTLEEIAWQKGGIFKEGVPAFTVNQPAHALEVLRKQAVDLKASTFTVINTPPQLSTIRLGLAGSHQVQNANLAINLAREFLGDKEELPETYRRGLETTKWPGRCQRVADPKYKSITWFLDGAHTKESLTCCMEWFVSPGVGLETSLSLRPVTRILIFNCTSGRSGKTFLDSMKSTISSKLIASNLGDVTNFFDHVIFCTNVTYVDGGFKGDLTTHAIPKADLAVLKTQQDLASAWSTLYPDVQSSKIHVLPSIEHAVRFVQELEATSGLDVLVTGSLHLVGGIIEVADLAEVAL